MKEKMNNKGFSLVELIIVIAIMAILVGVLAPQFIKYVEKSRQSTDIQNVQSYKTAIEAAAANEELTGDTTISVGTGSGATISIGGGIPSGGLSGVNTSTPAKSTTWGSQTYTFSLSTLSWGSNAANQNTKDPKLDISSPFK